MKRLNMLDFKVDVYICEDDVMLSLISVLPFIRFLDQYPFGNQLYPNFKSFSYVLKAASKRNDTLL